MRTTWLAIAGALLLTPAIATAERAPGYENYPNGHEGYLGDGILKAGEDPTAESLVASLEQIQDLPMAGWGNLSFSPDDHAGVEQVRTVQWRTECECWTALDDFRDPRS